MIVMWADCVCLSLFFKCLRLSLLVLVFPVNLLCCLSDFACDYNLKLVIWCFAGVLVMHIILHYIVFGVCGLCFESLVLVGFK